MHAPEIVRHAPAVLQEYFNATQIKVLKSANVDLPRMAEFMVNTLKAGGKISKLTLSTPAWVHLFKGDEDFEYLLSGCAYGFTWEAKDPAAYFEVKNYVPPEHETRVTERIQSEFEAGNIVKSDRSSVCGLSAIGIVDKQRSGFTKFRVVHDYSRPSGDSVNDNMEVSKRKFAKFEEACTYLRPNAYFCKVDLKDAYRSVPMAQEWWPRHAFQWEGQVYQDLRMPFGSKGAPAAFDRITQVIVRSFKAWGFNAFIGYLDDFWLMVAD